ncbi:flagellin C protein [Fulvimarina pelagi HTCC2506]|uniref:Flagellin n=1 Tax=Fulvimarina pelagi HTCC2506 TaxID=314231 RepID=Q0G161_9HYPH|nr:flagellin [Fulvimarina pelagi]EAU40778.1 flagellin C protein [Fulvimarina pelagi HTCC2506]
MTSINTNVAAMTALQTLQSTNSMMDDTQNRISTGYRVGQASDNAAYWSIATTMRSDVKAMSSVADSLGIGASTVDTAYEALSASKDVLDEIKAKLTTATQDGVDRTKVQDEITQLQNQLKSIASSASFSGQNWLSIDSSAASYTSSKDMISSFSRSAGGSLSVGSIRVDTSSFALFDASGTKSGIIDSGKVNMTAVTLGAGTSAAGTAGPPATSGTYTPAAPTAAFTLDSDDMISFTLAVDGGTAQKVLITKGIIDDALGTTDGVVSSANYAKVFAKAVDFANVTGVSVNATTGVVTSNSTGTTSTVAFAAGSSDSIGVSEMDITKSTVKTVDIKAYINIVDSAISKVTAAASTLGSVKNRIDIQTSFVNNLMDTFEKGIGTLVDADMTEESTKLKALQTQQQLGVQALSIANNSTQTLLQLFR